ncbi:MAG TPA: quinone-dependent dihydroorotate dehydrogenase [Candidatus Obscuribacterales bacterium]
MSVSDKTPAMPASQARASGRRPDFYTRFLRPLLFKLDPEDAHGLAMRLAPLISPLLAAVDELPSELHHRLSCQLFGIQLANPLGLAAGFDKNAKLTACLGGLGFGFEEVGSITGQPSPGNPKPRLFRLAADEAIINRLGLNGEGAAKVGQRLRLATITLPIGVNIAKTNHPSIKGDAAVEDVVFSFQCIKDLPLAYVTINASCPNTHEGIMEQREEIGSILDEVQRRNLRNLPVLLKISPDSSTDLLNDLIELGEKHNLKGFVCGNTTISRHGLKTPDKEVAACGQGGLSGPPLKSKALDLCRKINSMKRRDQQIIGCGGISTGSDAYEFIRAGASAVEIYTALVYGGPFLPRRINFELARLLERDGLSVAEAVGIDCNRL